MWTFWQFLRDHVFPIPHPPSRRVWTPPPLPHPRAGCLSSCLLFQCFTIQAFRPRGDPPYPTSKAICFLLFAMFLFRYCVWQHPVTLLAPPSLHLLSLQTLQTIVISLDPTPQWGRYYPLEYTTDSEGLYQYLSRASNFNCWWHLFVSCTGHIFSKLWSHHFEAMIAFCWKKLRPHLFINTLTISLLVRLWPHLSKALTTYFQASKHISLRLWSHFLEVNYDIFSRLWPHLFGAAPTTYMCLSLWPQWFEALTMSYHQGYDHICLRLWPHPL